MYVFIYYGFLNVLLGTSTVKYNKMIGWLVHIEVETGLEELFVACFKVNTVFTRMQDDYNIR